MLLAQGWSSSKMKIRMMLIGIIFIIIAICVAWMVYIVFPRSVNVTLTGLKYQLGAEGANTATEQATVVIQGELYTNLKNERTFKGEVNIVGEQIPVPADQRNLEIHFADEGWGVMAYPYFHYDQRGAVIGSSIYTSHMLFTNKDFSQVTLLLNISDNKHLAQKPEDGVEQTVVWNISNGDMISAPASTREDALALSNKLMYNHIGIRGMLLQ